jgi:hypothetical protein
MGVVLPEPQINRILAEAETASLAISRPTDLLSAHRLLTLQIEAAATEAICLYESHPRFV